MKKLIDNPKFVIAFIAFCIIIGMILLFTSCTKNREQILFNSTWQIDNPDKFSGDKWKFTNTFDVYRNGQNVHHELNWSLPDIDLSAKKPIALFIFDDDFLTYAANNPGYSTDYFFQGSVVIEGDRMTYISVWDSQNKIYLHRIQN